MVCIVNVVCADLYRVAKTHRVTYFFGSFPAKQPYDSCFLVENDLQLKAFYVSSPPFMQTYTASQFDHKTQSTVSMMYSTTGLSTQ